MVLVAGVSLRAINRTYLDRQMLLRRSDRSLDEVLHHLVALQAQDSLPPYVSLWSRMEQFRPEDLEAGLLDRSLVRGTFLRATVHLSRRDDVLHLMPHMVPEYFKMAHGPSAINGLLQRLDAGRVIKWGTNLLRGRDLGNAELRAQASIDFPDFHPQEVASAVTWLLPVVQVPPRGLWKNNSTPRWSLVDDWLGTPLDDPSDAESLVLRFIRSHGPIATGDFQRWSRMTGITRVTDRLRPNLQSFIAEDGRTYLDDPEITWVDERTPAPVRLLGHFDNALLSHKDRRRIIRDAYRTKIMSNGVGRAAILVDGFVAGRYKTSVKKGRALFRFELFEAVTAAAKREIESEASRLLAFMDPGMDQVFEEVDNLTA